jgi:hypothetical protein
VLSHGSGFAAPSLSTSQFKHDRIQLANRRTRPRGQPGSRKRSSMSMCSSQHSQVLDFSVTISFTLINIQCRMCSTGYHLLGTG